MRNRERYTYRIDWNSIEVEIAHEPCWMDLQEFYGSPLAHIEVRSVKPKSAKLPVTETGYRSHFVPNAAIIEAGGPIEYACAWLDAAAQSPAWKDAQERDRQLVLL
jgi:hypothetical protein